MTSANLNLVRSICAAWERGDYSSTEWAHPEIVFVSGDGPAPGSRTGLAGMAEGWREVLSAWDEFHQEADDYLELDDERVLVFFRFSGRGKTSGLELEQMRSKGAGLFHVRDGKVTRFVGYLDRERAIADVGSRARFPALVVHFATGFVPLTVAWRDKEQRIGRSHSPGTEMALS